MFSKYIPKGQRGLWVTMNLQWRIILFVKYNLIKTDAVLCRVSSICFSTSTLPPFALDPRKLTYEDFLMKQFLSLLFSLGFNQWVRLAGDQRTGGGWIGDLCFPVSPLGFPLKVSGLQGLLPQVWVSWVWVTSLTILFLQT